MALPQVRLQVRRGGVRWEARAEVSPSLCSGADKDGSDIAPPEGAQNWEPADPGPSCADEIFIFRGCEQLVHKFHAHVDAQRPPLALRLLACAHRAHPRKGCARKLGLCSQGDNGHVMAGAWSCCAQP